MRILVAPDKFRGTATAAEIVDAVLAGLSGTTHEGVGLPLADGGEGTLDVLGGANRTTTVTGPLGDPVDAGWRMQGRTAIIEMAQASGLALVGGSEGNDPIAATTAGTGELIGAAVEASARRIVVTVGGSATTDGGLGALRGIMSVPRLRGVELVVACDVSTKFLDAATVFGPQKGATPAQVRFLANRLERTADLYREEYGIDVTDITGSGAAGGLAGGLAAVGAQLVGGFDLVADETHLDEELEFADLVISGEGLVDAQSLEGKVVGGVIDRAERAGIPVVVIAGQVEEGLEVDATTISLADEVGIDRALDDTTTVVTELVRRRYS